MYIYWYQAEKNKRKKETKIYLLSLPVFLSFYFQPFRLNKTYGGVVCPSLVIRKRSVFGLFEKWESKREGF